MTEQCDELQVQGNPQFMNKKQQRYTVVAWSGTTVRLSQVPLSGKCLQSKSAAGALGAGQTCLTAI